MNKYTGITAERALALSCAAPADPEDTLSLLEAAIGESVESRQRRAARAVLPVTAHSRQGVEYALRQLSQREFEVSLGESRSYYTIDVSW